MEFNYCCSICNEKYDISPGLTTCPACSRHQKENQPLTGVLEVELHGVTDRDFTIKPGEFILASTEEYIYIPHWIAARVEGKSTLGRIGLMVHVTAGFIDPGFPGNITLELKNLNNRSIIIRRFMQIAQICFTEIDGDVERPYGSPGLGSHYQNSKGTVGPRR